MRVVQKTTGTDRKTMEMTTKTENEDVNNKENGAGDDGNEDE